MDDLISRLSEIRSRYNCFDESEEPYYRALSDAIKLLSGQADGDTISRKAAIDIVKGIDGNFVKYIEELPSAQPERKKGEWIKRGSWYCCSECGTEMFFTGVYDEDQHYCYNCGSYNGGGDDADNRR